MEIRSYLDSVHYKIGYKLELYLKNVNHSHIIIYGTPYSGKTILIKSIFHDIYNGMTIRNEPFYHVFNNNYYYFDIKRINDKNDFIKFIKEIVNSFDQIFHFKYIIIDHYDFLSHKYQNILKVILEKCYITTKFIILTNKLNKIITPIISRCFSLRIPSPSTHDKYLYFKSKVNMMDDLLLKRCKEYPLHQIPYNYDNIIMKYALNIKEMVVAKLSILKIDELRKLCENIKELDIPFNDIFYHFLMNINDQKSYLTIIKIITYYEYLNCKAYRPLIYLEALILKLNEVHHDTIS